MDIFQYANNVRELLNKKLDEAIALQKNGDILPEILSVPIQMNEHVAKAVDIVLREANRLAKSGIQWNRTYDTIEQRATFSIDVTPETLETLRKISLKETIGTLGEEVTSHLAIGGNGRGVSIKKSDFKTITPENFVALVQCLASMYNISCHQPVASLDERVVQINTLSASPEGLLNVSSQENQNPVINVDKKDAWTPKKEPSWVSGKHLHDLTNSYGYQGPIVGSQAEKIQRARDAAKNSREVIAM